MKPKKRVIAAILIVAVIIVLFGCPFMTPNLRKGNLALTIRTEAGGRTILPGITVASYLISFSGPVAHDPVSTTQSDPTITLEPGTWTITVEGKDSGGNVVAVGSASGVVVSDGAVTPVAITLRAQSSGSGTIDVTVTWPSDVLPAIDAGSEVKLDGVAVPPSTVTFGGTSMRYVQANVSSGSYQLCFNLKSGSTLRASVQEAVQVYMNLTSSAIITLTDSDFTSAPAAPSGLGVAEGLGKLDLSWTDNSHVETGYVVERSTGDNLHYGQLAGMPLPANTTSYSDTTAVLGQMYWYRVKARNSLGDSGSSNEVSGKVEAPTPGGSEVLSFSEITTSSIRVSWQKATDNVSAQAALGYKVVRSLTNNVRTVGEALANGTVVQDWTLDSTTANATGLSSGTTYYFNVLVKNEAGNTAAYSSSTATSGTGTISMTITVTSPQDEIITFDHPDDIIVAWGSIMVAVISEVFDSYEWMLDGNILVGQTTATVSIDCATLDPGVHHLTVFVQKNGNLFSKNLRFVVEN